jgi:hypothetical protein
VVGVGVGVLVAVGVGVRVGFELVCWVGVGYSSICRLVVEI